MYMINLHAGGGGGGCTGELTWLTLIICLETCYHSFLLFCLALLALFSMNDRIECTRNGQGQWIQFPLRERPISRITPCSCQFLHHHHRQQQQQFNWGRALVQCKKNKEKFLFKKDEEGKGSECCSMLVVVSAEPHTTNGINVLLALHCSVCVCVCSVPVTSHESICPLL